MHWKLILRLAILFQIGQSCSSEQQPYSFFVAGHVYGSPQDSLPGLHPPFLADLNYTASLKRLAFGFFTGDIVYKSTEAHWDAVDETIKDLNIPIHFAVGNHDGASRNPFHERYGKSYKYFEFEQDLFIILNPGLGAWNIWKDQMDFLKLALTKSTKCRNVFVFFHQVLWWSDDGKYPDLRINSLDGRAPKTNFWNEVEPLFRSTNKPVYLFAGDVGASPDKTSFFYDNYENITLIASGMGNLIQDNYVLVEVDQHGQASIAIRWLQAKRTQRIADLVKSH